VWWISRTLWLVLVAMIMFAAGALVIVIAHDAGERVLGGVAILSALVVVVTNVFGNGRGHGD
jgi:hypothetical protein